MGNRSQALSMNCFFFSIYIKAELQNNINASTIFIHLY